MNQTELIAALERMKVETGSLACLGCGHEHSCSTHGCAIIREAVALVKAKALQELPAADAVTVGRCGTCKKAMTKDCLLCGFDENGYCTGGPGSDYYCADYNPEDDKQ